MSSTFQIDIFPPAAIPQTESQPEYLWNPKRQLYEITRIRRVVPQTQIRDWIDETIATSRERVRLMSEDFVAGRINLPTWATRMQQELKGGHIAMAEIASGGRKQFTNQQAGRVGARLRSEYSYLNNFVNAAENGLVTGPQLVARAEMYAESLRGTYEGMKRGNHQDAGFTLEHSFLGQADHCQQCQGEQAKGWVPIGTVVPIGERTCLSMCACRISYKRK